MRPLFTTCLSFSLLLFCLVSLAAAGDTMRFDLEITDDLEAYALNLGDFCMHDGLSVEVNVKNSTSKSMIFCVTPSCSCAKLAETEISIGRAESKVIKFSIGRILTQQVVEFSLRLKDLDSNTVKVIGMKGNAVAPVHVKEESIRVKSSVATEQTITILSRFDRIKIDGAVVMGADYESKVKQQSPTAIEMSLRPKKEWQGSNLVLSVKLSNGTEDYVFVPIIFENKVNFITRELVFEKSDEDKEVEGYLSRVIVQLGPGNQSPDHWKIKAILGGDKSADVTVTKIVERTKSLLVLTLRIEFEKQSRAGKFDVLFSNVSEEWEKTISATKEKVDNEFK